MAKAKPDDPKAKAPARVTKKPSPKPAPEEKKPKPSRVPDIHIGDWLEIQGLLGPRQVTAIHSDGYLEVTGHDDLIAPGYCKHTTAPQPQKKQEGRVLNVMYASPYRHLLVIRIKNGTDMDYLVRHVTATTFLLEKLEGPRKSVTYTVSIGKTSSCSCEAFLKKGRDCKHVDAMRKLTERKVI